MIENATPAARIAVSRSRWCARQPLTPARGKRDQIRFSRTVPRSAHAATSLTTDHKTPRFFFHLTAQSLILPPSLTAARPLLTIKPGAKPETL